MEVSCRGGASALLTLQTRHLEVKLNTTGGCMCTSDPVQVKSRGTATHCDCPEGYSGTFDSEQQDCGDQNDPERTQTVA